MSDIRKYRLFVGLYLLSFAAMLLWVALLIAGIFAPQVMAFFNYIALPTFVACAVALAVFKRLATRFEAKGDA